MAQHTHLPSVPYFAEGITKNPDGTYDFSKAEKMLFNWKKQYNKAVDIHNKNIMMPLWFRLLTGYKNPKKPIDKVIL